MARRRNGERGSALVETAIVAPCLLLLVYGSIALTDVLLLKLEAAEALRYALWETTVFKTPEQIAAELGQRFPASHLTWRADLQTTRGGLGGTRVPPQAAAWWTRCSRRPRTGSPRRWT